MSVARLISVFGREALSLPVRILNGGDGGARNTAVCAQQASGEGLTAYIANGGLKLEVDVASAASFDGVSLVRPSVQNVLDWYIDGERGLPTHDPYWAELWASAIAIAQIVAEDNSLVRGQRIADVGCGLGVAGLVAAIHGPLLAPGLSLIVEEAIPPWIVRHTSENCCPPSTRAKQVTLLDREPKALQCALLTAAASGLQTKTSAAAFSQSPEEGDSLVQFTERLRSAAAADGRLHHEQSSTIDATVFDWNNEFTGEPYDTVIACDVLYENAAVDPLARLLPTMLAGPSRDGRRILLTDPQSRTPDHRQRFLDLLAEHDKTLVVDFVKTITVEHATAAGAPVKVIALRRRMAGDTIGAPLSRIQ